MRYKCFDCFSVVDLKPCPICGSIYVEPMCELDHTHCNHEIVSGLKYCPVCKKAVCPTCNSHDVAQISRVTGYLANVSGFNEGKKAELADRQRYDPKNLG